MTIRPAICCLALSLCLSGPAFGQPVKAEPGPGNPVTRDVGTFSILFENDIFFDSDHDYTNGVEFSYTTAAHETPQWAVDFVRGLPLFTKKGDVRVRYAIGQNIYTPRNLTLANPPPTDRPYAGFLYGAMGFIADSGNHLDQLQVQFGVIGPLALGENSQKFVHAIINDTKPMGWDTQLRNEAALVVLFQRSFKIIEPRSVLGGIFDIEPHYGFAVGNVYDYFNMGAMARFGFNLPRDYGPMRIDPALPGTSYFEPTASFGAYLFAGVDGRAVGRNIFLDGNSFESSRSVSKMNLVGDITFGGALVFENARLAFTQVLRSREYKTQASQDLFGAVDLSFRF